MKKFFTKSFPACALLPCAMLMVGNLASQETLTRTIKESLGSLDGGALTIAHRRGDVRIIKSANSEATFTLNIELEGKYRDEMEEFLEVFEAEVTGSTNNKRLRNLRSN